ncbi:MAG: OFA family MFS transporter [Bacillota bacterium]
MPNKMTKGWIVTYAGLGINLCLGVLYSWSVIKIALMEQLGWTNTAASVPYTVAIIVFAIVMVPAGRLTDKWGPRLIAILGGLFVGGGMILSGFSSSLTVLVVSFGILVGSGIGLGYAAPTPAAVKWFGPHQRGLISGLVVAGFGLASVYIAPLTNALLPLGIQKTFIIEGIIFLIAITILAQFLSFPPKGHQAVTANNGAAKAKDEGHGYSWQEMVKTPTFYLIWLTYLLGAGTGLMIIGHLASIAKLQAGISYGFILVALLAIANAGGRIVSGWLSDSLGKINTLFLVFLIQAANMFLFVKYTSGLTVAIGALIAGYCYGSLLSLYPSLTYGYYGMKNAGVNYGLVFTAWGVGGVLGPIIAGRVADITNVYNSAYLITGAACLLGAVLVKTMVAPKEPLPIVAIEQ